MNKEKPKFNIAIIGAGPAGLTAALFLARAGYESTIFEKEALGGQAGRAPRLENMPGVESCTGAEFVNTLYNQVIKYNKTNFIWEEVAEIICDEKSSYRLKMYDGTESSYDSVIVATGADPNRCNLPNEEELTRAGFISYCTLCDGPLHATDTSVAIIGDGSSALQYCVEMKNLLSSDSMIYLFTLTDQLNGEQVLMDQVLSFNNLAWEKEKKVIGAERLSQDNFIIITTVSTKDPNVIQKYVVNCIFVAIGQHLNKVPIKMSSSSAEKTDISKLAATGGLIGAGDCMGRSMRQVVTSCADGAVAARKVIDYLKGRINRSLGIRN